MNVLDENILESQRQLLRSWRFSIKQIGHDLGKKGLKDERIIPFLLQLRRPTFFTRDWGLYERDLRHARYCLVCLAVRRNEAAVFARRLLRHPEFDTQARRMGAVAWVTRTGISAWPLRTEKELYFDWPTNGAGTGFRRG